MSIHPTPQGMPSGEHAASFMASVGNLGEGNAMVVFCWVVTVKGSPKVAENKLDNKHIVAGSLDAPLIGRPAAHVRFDNPCAAAEELRCTLVSRAIPLGR